MADRWRESGSEQVDHRVDIPFDSFKSPAGVWFYLHHDAACDWFKVTLTDDVSVSIEMPRNQLRWMVGVCLDALKGAP